MEINRVTAQEYELLFPAPISVFNSVAFSELNKEKCVDIHYLVFHDRKPRLGLVVGEKEDRLCVPFSATYGGFSFNNQVSSQHYDDACVALKAFAESYNKPLYFTPAPSIYNITDHTKTVSALIRAGGEICCLDFNQHFELARFKDYENHLDSKNRNMVRKSLTLGLSCYHYSNDETALIKAYEIIRTNHLERNYPIRMTLQNILDTIKIIPADVFIVNDSEGHNIASAIIFQTTKDIFQVVYWGNIAQYAHLKSMNFMSYKIFEHYYTQGLNILDIGISTERGVPNYGLCEFKENIGCCATIKYSLKL